MAGLFGPAALLSGVIATGRRFARRPALVGASLLLLIGIAALVGASAGLWDGHISATSRAEIWSRSLSLAPFMVSGSGFGTFQTLYQTVENPFAVTRFYVNHAHNDALELLIEGGIAALILLILSLAWWTSAAWRAWRPSDDADPYARAGAVMGGVLLMHSLVDFPLRTEALMAVLATSVGLLVGRESRVVAAAPDDLRPTRHRRVR
jgi:O-antigen ligase